MKTLSIGKCSVWIYGAANGPAGWVEGLVLDVGEGFTNRDEAKAWARAAMKRLATEGKSPDRYKIGRAY